MARGQIEKRGQRRRKLKPVILIVTEGSQTEPKYFEHYRSRQTNIDIRVVGSRTKGGETDYLGLIRKAVEYQNKNQISASNGDAVWVVADGDVNYSVVFRGDFRGKSGHRTARKSPEVLRIGQTTPYRIVVFRYQFGVHFRRFSLMSFLPLALTTAFRSLWYARCGHGSSISLPQVVALHRRGAYPIQAGHSIGIIHR